MESFSVFLLNHHPIILPITKCTSYTTGTTTTTTLTFMLTA